MESLSKYNEVVLVDRADVVMGTMEKMEAHVKGLLHRAFSVFVFNSNNELLLQRRASHKYHSPGLWSNSCCSHPFLNESIDLAAKRRTQEELGIDIYPEKIFDFIYKASFDNGLTEHEYDHVFIAYSDQTPNLNMEEADRYIYRDMASIQLDIQINPKKYTEWFKICFDNVYRYWNSLLKVG